MAQPTMRRLLTSRTTAGKIEASPGRHVGHVGDPELVRAVGTELALDEVGRRALALGATSGHDAGAPATDTADGIATHQPGDALAADANALVDQLSTNPRPTVGGVGSRVNLANALDQHRIVDRALGRRTFELFVVAAG
jgi:hypothetical protein